MENIFFKLEGRTNEYHWFNCYTKDGLFINQGHIFDYVKDIVNFSYEYLIKHMNEVTYNYLMEWLEKPFLEIKGLSFISNIEAIRLYQEIKRICEDNKKMVACLSSYYNDNTLSYEDYYNYLVSMCDEYTKAVVGSDKILPAFKIMFPYRKVLNYNHIYIYKSEVRK